MASGGENLETGEITPIERIEVHSHIRGLGLNSNLEPLTISQGMVGQKDARSSAGILVQMILNGGIPLRGALLGGEPNTGKTALAIGMQQALGTEIPFTSTSGSEIYSLEMSKIEALKQALRKSTKVRIKEETVMIEGEIVQLQIDQGQNVGEVTLKTTEMEMTFNLGSNIDFFLEKKIQSGDVITIDKSSGEVCKLGRSFSRIDDATTAETRYVQCPEGELQKQKEVVHSATLHEIDVMSSRYQGFLAGDTGEIEEDVRDQVTNIMYNWREEGKAEIIPGVLLIDEVHMLDIECFSYLNHALDSDLAPFVILASNRGITRCRGANYNSPNGISIDLLKRLTFIHMIPYSDKEMEEILKIRCEEEGCAMNQDALKMLIKIAMETSLRCAIHLITTANLVSKRKKGNEVNVEDVKEAYSLFIAENPSSKMLKENQNKYLFDEEDGDYDDGNGKKPTKCGDN